jgi:hypothetical protein
LNEDFEIPPESVCHGTVERIAHPPFSFDSQIISDFPEIFAEFQKKRFSLLWQGSRDGFNGNEFHHRCDDHANTLTVILDTKGNIFGGFTPVEWESREWNRKELNDDNRPKMDEGWGAEENTWKADESQKSFLFTLKNPHNIPARRFMLKTEIKNQAIGCYSGIGPCFGNDIAVCDNCNASATNYVYLFGSCDNNDTELDSNIVLTGSDIFQVQEIEVFEITD